MHPVRLHEAMRNVQSKRGSTIVKLYRTHKTTVLRNSDVVNNYDNDDGRTLRVAEGKKKMTNKLQKTCNHADQISEKNKTTKFR